MQDNEKILEVLNNSKTYLKQQIKELINADASVETLSRFIECLQSVERSIYSLGVSYQPRPNTSELADKAVKIIGACIEAHQDGEVFDRSGELQKQIIEALESVFNPRPTPNVECFGDINGIGLHAPH